MIRDTIHKLLETHPELAGYVFVAGIYLSKAQELSGTSTGGGYKGP